MENSLHKVEFVALQFLIRHKELIIQKAAKVNTVQFILTEEITFPK